MEAVNLDWEFLKNQEGFWTQGYVPNVVNKKDGKIDSGVTILFGYDLGAHDVNDINNLAKAIKKLPIARKDEIAESVRLKLLPYVKQHGPQAVMAPQNNFERALNTLASLNSRPEAGVPITPPLGVRGNGQGPTGLPKPREKPTQFIARGDAMPRLELDKDEAAALSKVIKEPYINDLIRMFKYRTKGKRHFSQLPRSVQTALLSLHWQCGNIWAFSHANPRRQVWEAAIRGDWKDLVDTLRAEPFPGPHDRKRRLHEADLIARENGIGNELGPKAKAYQDKLAKTPKPASHKGGSHPKTY